MKNVFRLIGIIALVAVIGFSAVSCKEDNPTSLKIVNASDVTITSVDTMWVAQDWAGLSIAPGSSQTFALQGGGGRTKVTVSWSGGSTYKENVPFTDGETTTVTLSGSGGSYSLN